VCGRHVRPEEDRQPDAAPRGRPLAVESPPTPGLLVGEHDHVVVAPGGPLSRTSVRTRDGVVVLHLEGRVEPVLDGRAAELRDAREPVAILGALDVEARVAQRLDVFPDCRPRNPEFVREGGARHRPVGQRVQHLLARLLHTPA